MRKKGYRQTRMKYNRLVRDNMPTTITQRGQKPIGIGYVTIAYGWASLESLCAWARQMTEVRGDYGRL